MGWDHHKTFHELVDIRSKEMDRSERIIFPKEEDVHKPYWMKEAKKRIEEEEDVHMPPTT